MQVIVNPVEKNNPECSYPLIIALHIHFHQQQKNCKYRLDKNSSRNAMIIDCSFPKYNLNLKVTQNSSDIKVQTAK